MTNAIITISREYGSGGKKIGQIVAERLGIPFYDKQLIEETAKEAGLSEDVVRESEEKLGNGVFYNFVLGAIYGVAYPEKPKMKDLPTAERIFLAQKKIIEELAAKGPCVIVGRCADYILKDKKDVLKVFIYADKKEREKRAIEEYNRIPEYIEQAVSYMDKRRRLHYETYTTQNWGDRTNYHLLLDSGKFGIEGCAEIICNGAKK